MLIRGVVGNRKEKPFLATPTKIKPLITMTFCVVIPFWLFHYLRHIFSIQFMTDLSAKFASNDLYPNNVPLNLIILLFCFCVFLFRFHLCQFTYYSLICMISAFLTSPSALSWENKNLFENSLVRQVKKMWLNCVDVWLDTKFLEFSN